MNLKWKRYETLGVLWFSDDKSVGADEVLNYINELKNEILILQQCHEEGRNATTREELGLIGGREMSKYYRNTMLKLFKVYGGWHVAAKSIEDVKGLAMKRGNDEPSDNDIELVEHNCTVIERVCETYEEVCKTNNEEIDSLKSRLNEITEAIPKLKNPERIHCPDNQVSQVNAGEANSGTIQEYQTLLVNLKGYFYDNLKKGEKIDNLKKIYEMILDFESTL